MMSNVTGSAIQLKQGEPAHRDMSKLTNFIRNYTTGYGYVENHAIDPPRFSETGLKFKGATLKHRPKIDACAY